MAAFSIDGCSFCFSLFILFSIATPIVSLSPQTLDGNPSFDPQIALFGDAHVANDGSHVQLMRQDKPGSGLMLQENPIRLVEGNVARPTSFSTEFSFSISADNGDGLAFILVPYDFSSRFASQGPLGLLGENRFLGVEFDTKNGENVGDLRANHVGIDVGSLESVKVSNLSSLNLVLNNGEMLKSWIDYDASSKRLEVKLSKVGEDRPHNPILAYRVDLLEMLGDGDLFPGLISTNGNHGQSSSVYSWRFRLRKVSSWMHSLPADPRGHEDRHGEDSVVHNKKRFCALTVLAGLIFGTGCGALLAFVVLFMWAIVISRHTDFPVESKTGPADFRYEKINVIVENDHEDE